ncbi:MAG: iron-containing alcohol dehydrogenase [Pseudomonadota bacterium]
MARSTVTKDVRIGKGVLGEVGRVVKRFAETSRVLVMADEEGFDAAGSGVIDSLQASGFTVETIVLPCDPLPVAAVEEAEPFRAALAADPQLFPVSVGSGVINDLVKWAAKETGRSYVTVATAASMDGYTSAGAPLARDGFKVTIPTRAPVAMVADLDVIAAAPAEMNGWGYGDLAGKMPAGGDWMLADALGVEGIDDSAWPLVQDNLRFWLSNPEGIATGDPDSVARLFVGLTAVGFAMEFHGSSRPASGADHQIAHLWEMEGHKHAGRKVSHGAAVSVGCIAVLALFDWLIEQDLSTLDTASVLAVAPTLADKQTAVAHNIPDAHIAQKAQEEVAAKHPTPQEHEYRLNTIKSHWPALRQHLRDHLLRADEMSAMLSRAGAPVSAAQIGVDSDHLMRTLRAASFIRRRYTIFDFLHDVGLTEPALTQVLPKLAYGAQQAAE